MDEIQIACDLAAVNNNDSDEHDEAGYTTTCSHNGDIQMILMVLSSTNMYNRCGRIMETYNDENMIVEPYED